MEMTELDDPDKAAEQFQKLMILEKVDPSDLVFVLNKVMEKAARSLK